jgi:transcriptional regulator with XRE-family HTH domain
MGRKRVKLSEQIRRAVADAPISRYAICKRIGFSQATMSRFMKGKAGLSMDVLDKVADVVGIDIAIRSEGKQPKGR